MLDIDEKKMADIDEKNRFAFLIGSVSEAKASIVELEKRVSAMEGDEEAQRRRDECIGRNG